MTQAERRIFLIQQLLSEQPKYNGMTIPSGETEQKTLLRSLINIRQPHAVTDEFLSVQDKYLQNALAQKGITELAGLTPVLDGIYLWRGDITTLQCGAIVNAANRGMTGCYLPCHQLYRQLYPYLCRCTAPACMCRNYKKAKAGRSNRDSKNHTRL